jgi:hypothetical protein
MNSVRPHPVLFHSISFCGDTFTRPLDELKLRFVAVTLQMLDNTWREIKHRLDILHVMKGMHVEVV